MDVPLPLASEASGMGPNGVHEFDESEPDESPACPVARAVAARAVACSTRICRLSLIGSAAKFGRIFPLDQTTAKKTFVALFDVVGDMIGI